MNTGSLDRIEEISLLLDFYGELLSEKQREYLRLYHEENCSLSEIADIFGVSRSGIYDGVRKAQAALRNYEDILGLVADYKKREDTLQKLRSAVGDIASSLSDRPELLEKLDGLKEIIKELDQ